MRQISLLSLLWACSEKPDATMDKDNDGYTVSEGDCDDDNADVGPSATDVYGDDIDSNCDGIDGVDFDLDGYASVESGGDDCDDLDPDVNVDALEVCDDIDNDCDGALDEVDDSLDTSTAILYYADNDQDGYGDDTVIFYSCNETDLGVTVAGDCDDSTAEISPVATEVCDGFDNDCNGEIDDGVKTTFYADVDADGYGDPSISIELCEADQPNGTTLDGTDCDDLNASVYPGAAEICDDLDNSCNSLIDDADPLVDLSTGLALYTDNDNDGFGNPSTLFYACDQPEGAAPNALDCNDNDPNTFVGAAELEALTECMTDADGDGFGDMNAQAPAVNGTDCDDLAFTTYPGAPDMMVDGIDQNCDLIDGQDNDWDGQASVSAGGTDCDDGDPSTYLGAAYIEAPTLCMTDVDGDGYGDLSPSSTAIASGTDCDDNDGNRNPGEPELCDGIDNDCDSIPDDGLTFVDYYLDLDGDGYGESSTALSACSQPSGMVSIDGDCNENDPLIHPGATEVGNDGIDQDCDGTDGPIINMMSDFNLMDVNPYSATYGQYYSPRDYLQEVSGWYFTHAT
ncbi:MAG: putative metal-binding motif-containing protein [Myxococcota bacterium]